MFIHHGKALVGAMRHSKGFLQCLLLWVVLVCFGEAGCHNATKKSHTKRGKESLTHMLEISQVPENQPTQETLQRITMSNPQGISGCSS